VPLDKTIASATLDHRQAPHRAPQEEIAPRPLAPAIAPIDRYHLDALRSQWYLGSLMLHGSYRTPVTSFRMRMHMAATS
jgi:hypothetical protein